MKRCPACNRLEADDALAFCRADGTPLVRDADENAGTIKLGAWPVEVETRTLAPGAATPDGGAVRSAKDATATLPDSRATSGRTQELNRPKSRRWMVAAAVLLAVLVVAAGAYIYKSRGGAGAQKNSIAVLPFANASGDPDLEYLSDGISESLINNLARIRSLRVIARNTAFSFKGRDASPQQIGSQLNVSAILTGRVARQGDTLSVQVDLVDAESGAEMWGDQYRRKAADILQVQDEIARDIADRLRVSLTGGERELLTKRYTNNPEAYEDYLKGRYLYYKGSEADWRKAVDYFNAAVAKDPNFSLAHIGLADCYGLSSGWLMPPAEAYAEVKEEARKALQIDDTLADAWAELGAAELFYDHDWAAAERDFKHALELNPDSDPARLYYSYYLMALGRTDESVVLLKRGLQSDPLSLPFNTNLSNALYFARRYDEAVNVCLKTLEMDGNSFYTRLLLGGAYQQRGQYEAAIAEFQKLRQQEGQDPWATASLGNAYGVSGRRDEAQKTVNELQELSKRRYVSPYFFALIYTGLGDKDQAFAYLDKAYEEHNDYLIYLKVEPLFDPLRSDPRFADLLRRVGLA